MPPLRQDSPRAPASTLRLLRRRVPVRPRDPAVQLGAWVCKVPEGILVLKLGVAILGPLWVQDAFEAVIKDHYTFLVLTWLAATLLFKPAVPALEGRALRQ